MSQRSTRSTAFLGEMGVGPQWTLRNPAPAALFADELPPAADAELLSSAPAAAAAAVTAAASVTPAATVALAAEPADRLAIASPQASPVTASASATPAAEAMMPPVPSMPAAPAAPAALPPSLPERRQPAAPAAAAAAAASDASDAPDDTAWFDDAPAPARPEPVSASAIAAMDWPALSAAIAGCTRCELCATRRNVVPGRGAVPASWAAIVPAPSRLDERERHLLSGEAGQLFDNMLKAIDLSTETAVYLTPLVKCRPQTADGGERSPTLDEVTACRPFLERELALSGARRVLTFGQVAAKGLLGAAARGKVHQHGAWSVVATYHPDDLLRKPQDKAKAWADLCLARASHD
ncbi:MAG: uracil-DNA glycosylase [Sphingomonadaceae bacterium]